MLKLFFVANGVAPRKPVPVYSEYDKIDWCDFGEDDKDLLYEDEDEKPIVQPQKTQSSETAVWWSDDLYPSGFGPDGWIVEGFVRKPRNLLKKMALDPDSTTESGPFSPESCQYKATGELETLERNNEFRLDALVLESRFNEMFGFITRLLNSNNFYNELLDPKFSSTKPNRAVFNCWEGIFGDALVPFDKLIPDFLYRSACGQILPKYGVRCDIVETAIGVPTYLYLERPADFSTAQHAAVRRLAYQVLHEMKVIYNNYALQSAALDMTSLYPYPVGYFTSYLDPKDHVTKLLNQIYNEMMPLTQRMIIRAARQWDWITSWLTGPLAGTQGPLLLRWTGQAGDYLGAWFPSSVSSGIPDAKATSGCSFPTQPQPMPLNVQYIPELCDYLLLKDLEYAWPSMLTGWLRAMTFVWYDYSINLWWPLHTAFLHLTPWFGVLSAAVFVSTLFAGATVLLIFSFWRGFSQWHTAVLLEVSGASVVALSAIIGLAWYDPHGQVLALLLLVVSACEFALLAACAVKARWERKFTSTAFSFFWAVDEAAWGEGASTALFALLGISIGVLAVECMSRYLLAKEKNLMSQGWFSADLTPLDEPLVAHAFEILNDRTYGWLKVWLQDSLPNIFGSRGHPLSAFTIPVAGQSGNEILSIFVLLCCVLIFVFSLLVSWTSSRTYRSDFMLLGSNYECGAEPLGEQVSAADMLTFFKIVCVFLVFEWELVVLFVAVPLIGVCGGSAVVALTLFILLIELGVLVELRSGATLFTKIK